VSLLGPGVFSQAVVHVSRRVRVDRAHLWAAVAGLTLILDTGIGSVANSTCFASWSRFQQCVPAQVSRVERYRAHYEHVVDGGLGPV